MPALRELQSAVMAALLDDRIEPALGLLRDSLHAPATQLGVYRNNVSEGFRKALAMEFPVIEQLVGRDYFATLAQRYQQDYPSLSGDLQPIGTHFAEFLHSRFDDTEYAYFADIARLEWAFECVVLIPCERPTDIGMLASVVSGDPAALRLVPRRDLRIVNSRFPVVTIWQRHQATPPIQLDGIDMSRAEAALVLNGGSSIELVPLSGAAAVFVEKMRDGASLGVAYEAAVETEPDFDLTATLLQLHSSGVFAGVIAQPVATHHNLEVES